MDLKSASQNSSGRCSAQAGVAAQGSDQTAGPPRGVPSSWGLSLDSGCAAAAPWKCWGLCWSTWGGEDVPETKGGRTRLFLGSSHRVQPSGQGDSPHLSDIDGQSQPVHTPEPLHLQVPDTSWLMAAEAGPGRGAELQHHTSRRQGSAPYGPSGPGSQPPPVWCFLEGPAPVQGDLSRCLALPGQHPAILQGLRACCPPYHLRGGRHTSKYLRGQPALSLRP